MVAGTANEFVVPKASPGVMLMRPETESWESNG